MSKHQGRAANRLVPADLYATGVVEMIAKKLMRKRGVMIAIAVIALMTLTAGVAAAASNKAHRIEAVGGVGLVTLTPGGTVGSEFKIKKNDDIKSVKISTIGEVVVGATGVMTKCKEKGKHSAGACDHVDDILTGGSVISMHSSSAKLKVSQQPAPYLGFGPEVIWGTLKGKLEATITITGSNLEVLSGPATLKIRSSDLESAYGCLLGVDNDLVTPVFGTIQDCIDSPGPNALSHYLDPTPGTGPVMVPVELHVVDTGKFEVASGVTEMKGKLKVIVDKLPDGLGGTSGMILISKGKAEFAGDHDHGAD